MFRRKLIASGITLMLGAPLSAFAADSADMLQIRNEIKALKQSYEARIEALEQRLQRAEVVAGKAENHAATRATASTPASAANAFNPEVSLILSGTYTNLSQDPASYRIGGFLPNGGEIGPGQRGFSLAESELVVAANIDPYLRGQFTLAVTPEDTVGVEEAYIQTLGLGNGLTVKAGRFMSGIGYLNEQHAHAWDFVDVPLAYQAFFGGQFKDDGVQLKWLAPSDTFLELGAEIGRGRNFPASDRDKNGAGAGAVFAHLGGDVGNSHSWRAGLSYLRADPRDRTYAGGDNLGVEVENAFGGNSRLAIADFIWKWAPDGNATETNFKLQGEYFRSREEGDLTYDSGAISAGANTDRYAATQSGWYLQGVYQLMPRWRVGLRRDQLDSGSVDYASNNTALAQPGFNPAKNSLMLDYSPSEFSRFRLQFAQDKSRPEVTDNQVFVQYLMSLGAHGAHKY